MQFVRFESPTENQRGVHPGIFALCNGLAATGALTATQRHEWRRMNGWFASNVTDPASVDPGLFARHPDAASWFSREAAHLLRGLAVHLQLLVDHGVPVRRVESDDPGHVIYRDEWQVLVVPHPPHPAHPAT